MKRIIKNGAKSALFLGAIMAVCFTFVQLLSLIIDGFSIATLVFALIRGILGGAVAGIAFGIIIVFFLAVQKMRAQKIVKDWEQQGYNVVYDDGTNYFVGKEAVGGWMFLFEDHLYFRPHGINFQNKECRIPLDQIQTVERKRYSKLADTGMEIQRIDGTIEKFAVNEPAFWCEKINETKNKRA